MSIQYYPGYSQEIVIEKLRVQTILSITNAFPMVVTTDGNHNYVVGMVVNFSIPTMFGMTQLNSLSGQVIDLTDNTLNISIDSTNFGVFSYPISLPSAYTPPVIIPLSSGMYLPPLPLPYGNQNSFEGTEYNDGAIGNLI